MRCPDVRRKQAELSVCRRARKYRSNTGSIRRGGHRRETAHGYDVPVASEGALSRYDSEFGRRSRLAVPLPISSALSTLTEEARAAEARRQPQIALDSYRRVRAAEPRLRPWADLNIARIQYRQPAAEIASQWNSGVWLREDAVSPTGIPVAARARTLAEIAKAPRRTILCASLTISAPAGQPVLLRQADARFSIHALASVSSRGTGGCEGHCRRRFSRRQGSGTHLECGKLPATREGLARHRLRQWRRPRRQTG
jgi:hypothetical protein